MDTKSISAQHTPVPPWKPVEVSPFLGAEFKPYWQAVRDTRPIGQTLKDAHGKPARFGTEAEARAAIAKAAGGAS